MAKITSEDCKNYLEEKFKVQDWKRISKYKKDNIWYRDFSNPELGIVSLKEENGALFLVNEITNKKLEEHKEVKFNKDNPLNPDFVLTVFDNSSVSGAKSIIKKYMSSKSSDPLSTIMNSNEFEKYQFALGSQFTFFFPKEVYYNPENNGGLDSLVQFETFDGLQNLSIMFMDKNKTDPDCQTSHLLTDILPDDSSFVDEYHLTINSNMTVKQCIQELMNLGIEYANDDDCLFNKEMQNVKIAKKQFVKTNIDLKSTIKENNIEKLQEFIDNKGSLNMRGHDSLLGFALKHKAYDCFELLLNHVWVEFKNKTMGEDGLQGMNQKYAKKIIDKLTQNVPKDFNKIKRVFRTSAIYQSELTEYFFEKLKPLLDNESIDKLGILYFEVLLKSEYLKRASKETVLDILPEFIYNYEMLEKLILEKNISTQDLKKISLQNVSFWVADRNINVYEYLSTELEKAKQNVLHDKSSGFTMIEISSDGTQTTSLQKSKNQYEEIMKVMHAINKNTAKLKF